MLLATLPMVAIQADNNITQTSFANNPIFQHFQKLQEDMNQIFSEFDKNFFHDISINPRFKTGLSNKISMNPATDFLDKGDKYELKMDLAGMDRNSIDVKLKDNLISIKAKSEQKKEEKEGDKIIHQERFVGMVQRTLSLPKDANAQKYTTDYKNGVLTVTIDKKE
jgi:HSP20 family protein